MADRVFTEVGFGNPTFISTEIEYEDGREERVPGRVPMKRAGFYMRLRIGTRHWAWDTKDGYAFKRRPRAAFKVLFGWYGDRVAI